MIIKTSTAFARLPDAELDNFAQGVVNSMTGNPAFPSPPQVRALGGSTGQSDWTDPSSHMAM